MIGVQTNPGRIPSQGDEARGGEGGQVPYQVFYPSSSPSNVYTSPGATLNRGSAPSCRSRERANPPKPRRGAKAREADRKSFPTRRRGGGGEFKNLVGQTTHGIKLRTK